MEFHKKLSELFELAQKHQLSANYPSGMMLDVEDGTFTYFVYVEVYETARNCRNISAYPQELMIVCVVRRKVL